MIIPFLVVINGINIVVALWLLVKVRRELKVSAAAKQAESDQLSMLTEAVAMLRGRARLMELVESINSQLQTDDGLSMKDAINRLEASAKHQIEAAEFLKVGVREDRLKAELDREQLQRLLIELYRLAIKVESTIATGERLEYAAQGVAKDLAAAHRRADAVVNGAHGQAADAASQQTQKERDNNK